MDLLLVVLVLFLAVALSRVEYHINKLVKLQRQSLDTLRWINHHLEFMHTGYSQELADKGRTLGRESEPLGHGAD